MPSIVVCPLSRIAETVKAHDASHLVTLINVATPVERPLAIAQENHLFLGVSDILMPIDGHVLPAEEHVTKLLAFVEKWGARREKPIVVHCYAGISRSTAAAFISACALDPSRSEEEIAQALRLLSPSATPNARLVEVADAVLGRNGRMNAAIRAIGRGVEAFEGVPFSLTLTRKG